MPTEQKVGSIFRDGRWITAGSIAGALLVAAACFSGAFTAFEMNEENWKSVVLTRMAFTFVTVFGGLFLIVLGMVKPIKILAFTALIAGFIAMALAYFPCGAQYFAGPEVRVGELKKIKIPGLVTNYRMLPESKTVSSQQNQPPVEVCLRLDDGTWYEAKCQRSDLEDSGLGETIQKGRWQIVSLPHLNRILSAKLQNPD